MFLFHRAYIEHLFFALLFPVLPNEYSPSRWVFSYSGNQVDTHVDAHTDTRLSPMHADMFKLEVHRLPCRRTVKRRFLFCMTGLVLVFSPLMLKFSASFVPLACFTGFNTFEHHFISRQFHFPPFLVSLIYRCSSLVSN